MSSTITIRKGRILWHARIQNPNSRTLVMNSPDYLYTSTHISQAILHGIYKSRPNEIIELTKLRVKKPIRLVSFQTSEEQRLYAVHIMGIKSFNLFSTDDIKLLDRICSEEGIDGYRAVWDQDQIAICKKSIRDKLQIESQRNFNRNQIELSYGFTPNNINFLHGPGAAYYQTANKRRGRKLVRAIKKSERVKHATRKLNRVLTYEMAKI